MPIIQSPDAHIEPFMDTGIPRGYWKEWVVPWGKILMTKDQKEQWKTIENDHLYMMIYSPNQWSVRYTGDSIYPQFSESSYIWQCVAFAKVVSDTRNTPSSAWKPWQSLLEFLLSPLGHLPSEYRGLMIACFDNKTDYSLALANRKHVAILLGVTRNSLGNPTGIIVVDQNYYNFPPYDAYRGKIAKHTIPLWTSLSKGVGYARNYHIVTI